jgi:hypothetical protein
MSDSSDLRSAWHVFCDRLKDGVEIALDPDRPIDDVDRAEGVRALLRRLTSEINRELESGGTSHPELAWIHPFKNGQDNPDGLYQMASLDLSRTYRLSGTVGSVRYLGITAMTTDFSEGAIEQFLALNGDELPIDTEGRFSIAFGAGPAPAPGPEGTSDGAWYELPPRRCSLIVRQFFSDWDSEVPADLHLECVDPGPSTSRLDATGLEPHLTRIADNVVDMTAFWAGFGASHLVRGEVNAFDHVQAAQGASLNFGGSVDQGYGQTWYRIAADEALLLEVEIPECSYWEIQLGDVWYQSLDWWNRQSSLNGDQAVVSADGVFRTVIAHHDLGVTNWLDTTGSTQGCITYRWNQADRQPVPTCTLVPLATLDDHLDDRWDRITPDQRAVVLRNRRRGALLRFRR